MIRSTTDTTSATTTTEAATGGAKPLEREAFLKLLVAQISHQDPLKPMEGTEFVTQLSQFAAVEQAIAQTSQLTTLSAQIRGVANNASVDLVGKRVNMRGRELAFDGLTATSASGSLDAPAANVTAEIVDANGRAVRTIELGARPAGAFTVNWDGKIDGGATAPQGTYTLRIKATTADGKPVGSTQDVSGTVVKVSFDKGYPELTLDNGAKGAISDLVGVEGKPVEK
jgi:flagellar basal-body rod modification protein FlgD